MVDHERLSREPGSELGRDDRARVVRRRMFEVAGATPPEEPHLPRPARDALVDRLRDRLPPRLQGMAPFGPHHAAALLVVVALVMFLLSWWVNRSGPRGEIIPSPVDSSAVPAVAVATGFSAGAAPGPASTGSAPVEVVVDVAGRVRHPGVYHLPEGSRVIDALEAAGGTGPGIDLTQVNLARLLSDGEQILILKGAHGPVTSAPGGTSGSGTPAGPININRADRSLLETLPGVGPVTASAIVSWREKNGPFASVGDLVEVSGIGDVTLERLRPYITV